MARRPFPLATVAAGVMLAAGVTLLGISLTQPDPGTRAANASACASGHTADDAYCWVDKPAIVDDTGTTTQTIDYRGHTAATGRSGGQQAVIGWITLDLFPATAPGPRIPVAAADLHGLGVQKGDKVTARVVQGEVISISNAHARASVMGATPGTYPLVFFALFFLVVGIAAAVFSRDKRLTGVRRTATRVADRVLVPLLGVAVVVFYIHRSSATLAGVVLTAVAVAAGQLAGSSFSRPTARTRTAPPRRP